MEDESDETEKVVLPPSEIDRSHFDFSIFQGNS